MFSRVAVIGAGTMGAGIAGQVANSGVDVLLLDVAADDADNINAFAQRGLDRLLNPEQPGLMSDELAGRITLGNIRDDLHRVSDCDWVAEAVVERLPVKQALYKDLARHLKPGAILTSNTSTIPIRLLTEGMSAAMKSRFAITHFFNPVRYMRLLELVRGEHTDEKVMRTLAEFCESALGKGVVDCADTPGFLANRVGCFAIQCALHEAFEQKLSPVEADALFGRPMGIPKTGVFGLYDLIGIDLMSDVASSLVNILPAGDAFHQVGEPLAFMQDMIARGLTGNKAEQGFYRNTDTGERQVIDLRSGDYRAVERPDIPAATRAEQEGVHHLLDDNSQHGQYAWRVLSRTLCYAASLIPEVGNDPLAVDDAMKLGYNWNQGPFELLDAIGVDRFIDRLEQENRAVPAFLMAARGSCFYQVNEAGQYQRRLFVPTDPSPDTSTDATANHTAGNTAGAPWQVLTRPDGVMRFSEIRPTLKAQNSNQSASWFELDGVALVEFHTKANALDAQSMAILADALESAEPLGLAGVVIHNDAPHFSCGVNLERVRAFYRREDWDGLDQFLADFQQTVLRMANSQLPVVAAPAGLSIGGGFEVVLHAQRVIAHANSVMGLVESLVGLVPGGGGCKETLYRWVEQLSLAPDAIHDASWKAFKNLGYGRTTSSPQLAREQAMLYDADDFVMNRDRLLARAISTVKDTRPQRSARPVLHMPGREVMQAMADWLDAGRAKGHFTEHDTVVGRAVASIVAGDCEAGAPWDEQALLDAERRAFLSLAQSAGTQARIDSMLDLGKTLRN